MPICNRDSIKLKVKNNFIISTFSRVLLFKLQYIEIDYLIKKYTVNLYIEFNFCDTIRDFRNKIYHHENRK